MSKDTHKIKGFADSVKDITESGVVTIAIAHFDNEDRAGDIIRKGAFKKTMREQIDRVKHQIDHSMSVNDMVGVPVKMYETDEHAVVESALALNTTQGRNVYELYKLARTVGRPMEHSFRYITMKRNNNQNIPGEDIVELALRYEYSTVLAGCNPLTPVLDMKNAEDRIAMVRAVDMVLRSGQFTDEVYKALETFKGTLSPHSNEPTPLSLVKPEPLDVKAVTDAIKQILFS